MPSPQDASSRRTIGPYEVVEELGRGGMGVVYRARDSRLQRDVALKLLHGAADDDPTRLHRFLEEARAAAALNHPNILSVHDVAIDADTPYIVSELIDGTSLRHELDRGPLKPARLLDLATQIADGLTAAHRAGLVHRDLKPENVMISRDGRAKIVDFGLAKPLGLNQEGVNTRTLTAPHSIVGTPAYMSPEQARGSPVDFRSDLFSFGAMLYEMASRQRAFDRQSSIDTLSAILHEDPRPLSQLNDRCPPELQRIVERCLAKAPEDRYAATADLLHDLRWTRDRPNPRASADIAADRSRRWLVRVVAAIGIAAAAFVGGRATSPRLGEDPSGAQLPTWRRLTYEKGNVHSARFAPDGQTVIYSAAWDGRPYELYSMNLKSPESRRLDVPPAGLLAISPSGELAMALGCTFDPSNGSCNGTLALKQMLGGAPRSIRGDVRSADWGADGKLAAIAGTFENRRVEYPLGTQLSSRMAGGHVRVSHDGRDVAWTEAADNGLDVMIRDATGVARSLGRWDSVSGLAWSPDNSAVYVSGVAETNRDDAVTRIARDGSHREVLRARTRLRILDVTADGRLLVAQSESSLRVFIRTIESSTSRPADLTWLGTSMVDAISEDGAVVLLTVRVGAAMDWNVPLYPIFMRTTDGALPTHLGAGYGLAVSPDRRWALSRTRPVQGQPDLVIHPLGAGESRRLERGDLDVGGGNSAAHFAGPERIVFRARRDAGPWQTYVQSIANGPPTRLQHEPGMILSPVAPNRDQFISQRTDGSLWIATVSGSAATPLPARLESNQRIIQWSADGRELFVSTITGTRLRVTRLEIATGRQSPVTEFEADNPAGFIAFGFGAVFITPDGKTLTYTESRTLADLFLIEGAR